MNLQASPRPFIYLCLLLITAIFGYAQEEGGNRAPQIETLKEPRLLHDCKLGTLAKGSRLKFGQLNDPFNPRPVSLHKYPSFLKLTFDRRLVVDQSSGDFLPILPKVEDRAALNETEWKVYNQMIADQVEFLFRYYGEPKIVMTAGTHLVVEKQVRQQVADRWQQLRKTFADYWIFSEFEEAALIRTTIDLKHSEQLMLPAKSQIYGRVLHSPAKYPSFHVYFKFSPPENGGKGKMGANISITDRQFSVAENQIIGIYDLSFVGMKKPEELLAAFDIAWRIRRQAVPLSVQYHLETSSVILMSSKPAVQAADRMYQHLKERHSRIDN